MNLTKSDHLRFTLKNNDDAKKRKEEKTTRNITVQIPKNQCILSH